MEAAIARLTAGFQERERMLLAAVVAHAERERELQDRLEALERRLKTLERATSPCPDPQPPADSGVARPESQQRQWATEAPL